MPVGTNFENSAMKASFSLSSLPPSTGLESPEHAKIKNERLYNSLTKKRKDSKQENWRRSWGSTYDNNDFWSALQPNYDYIMNNHLIDSCKEIDHDIRAEPDETDKSLNQFNSLFSELHAFLENVLEAIYGKAENVTNRALRASYLEDMAYVAPRKYLFDEQACYMMQEMPALKDEVSWRVGLLNSEWEQVETALSSNRCPRCEKESCSDVENEVKCLRKWVNEMENRLQPLKFHVKWTLPELEKKALEHMVLQRDIENHSKIVSSVVRLCNDDSRRDPKCFASNAKRVASRLERRYHLLFLRSLEWQCHIESLVKLKNSRFQNYATDSDSDEEPCLKQPRLSADYYEDNNRGANHCDQDEDMDIIDSLTAIVDECSAKMVNDRSFEHDSVGTTDCQSNGYTMTENKHDKSHDDIDSKSSSIYSELSPKFKNDKTHKERNTLKKLHTATTNVGSYIYEHRDTDSEMDNKDEMTTVVSSEKEDDKNKDESSEDEFTYSKLPPLSVEPIDEEQSESKVSSKESIQLLVEKVEELVSSPKIDPFMFHTEHQKSKLSLVKEWLNYEDKDKPTDSCDASGECTSGESDDDRQSESSEDFNESIVTCRPQTLNTSTLNVQDTTGFVFSSPDTAKVHLRPKRLQMKGNRPWSVSSLSQLSQLSQTSPVKHGEDPFTNFSISESALNKLAISSPTSSKMRSFNTSAHSIGVHGNNSTSSTVEDSGVAVLNEACKSISAKKKKFKWKKKHITRKTESGSESQSYHSPCCKAPPLSPTKQNVRALVKSGSFSGCDSKKSSPERSTVSDPSGGPRPRGKGVCDTSTTSGPDSEDDKKLKRLPNFVFGPREGTVKVYSQNSKGECRDSSPEKSSLNTAEEQSSSLSEQAWDNYQEKYLSENYSEAHDSDAARRLLEFGEDYCNYLDSPSDCWSGHSLNHERSPLFKRKPQSLPFVDAIDSDSEIENVKLVIQKSKSQLTYTTDVYNKYVAMGFNEFLVSNDCAEIIETCERHIYCLEVIIDTNDDAKVLPDIEVAEVKALMSSWMDLKWSAKKMQRSRALHNEIIALKEDFSKYAIGPDASVFEFKSKEELTAEIDRLAADHAVLQEKKRRLLELNVAVHRYVVNEEIPGGTNLKSEVSELYAFFNDICQGITEKSNSLNSHLQAWAQIEARLDELQSDLRSDEETLQLLDTALKGGIVPKEVAHTVRDVAKVLSESTNATQRSAMVLDNASTANLFNSGIRSLSLSLLTEGSFSDSGISDEGSEQELSEREHRLTAIRRLVRQLEAIMAPDSEARIKMTERLEQAENELKKLQNQCRGLIVRTAVCAEAQSRENKQDGAKASGSGAKAVAATEACGAARTSGDPDDYDGDSTKSWFWRVVRASMSFQVAFVALLCVACLLEPSCCDSLNNLNLSLTPQLRYVRGPPPV